MPTTRRASDLDPRLIRLTTAVGWFWLAICLAGGFTVGTGILVLVTNVGIPALITNRSRSTG